MDNRAEAFYGNIARLYSTTSLVPFALILTVAMGFLLLVAPKRNAIFPLFIVVLFVTPLQRIEVFSLNFTMARVLIIVGWIRIILKREQFEFRLVRTDALVVLLGFAQFVVATLQWRTAAAAITSLGLAIDNVALYLLVRLLLPDETAILRLLRSLSLLVIPIAISMVVEQVTGRNLFSVFGGVPEFAEFRVGRLRSQAAFLSPITAGSFGASLLPWLFAMWRSSGKARAVFSVGILATFVVTLSSASSGPVIAFVAGVVALLLWFLSGYMREVLLLCAAGVAGLALVMKAPVYALIGRVSVFGGSTGDYRYRLIDQFVHRFREWALLGVRSTAGWGYDLFDVTSQYIRVAVDGGLVSLLLFFAVIMSAYSDISRSFRQISPSKKPRERLLLWAMGSSIFVHLISFISVSYFDQMQIVWIVSLAISVSYANWVRSEGSKAPGALPNPDPPAGLSQVVV